MTASLKKQRHFKPKTKQSTLLDSSKAFANKERPSVQEINIFRELFYALVVKTSSADLEAISGVLARLPYTPRPIAMYLAMEPIQIASPFLLFSPVLNDSDLRAISESRPPEYLDIIKRRDGVSQNLFTQTDHKAATGHEGIKTVALKQKKVVSAPPVIKVRTVKNEQMATKPVDRSSELIALANKGGRLERTRKSQTANLEREDFQSLLLSLLRHGKQAEFSNFLAAKTGLDRQLVSDYINLDDIGQLAALYRALDIETTIGARLLLLTSQNLGRDGNIFSQVVGMLKKLDIAECREKFITLGANFANNVEKETNPDKLHFARLIADRRRSVQASAGKTETEQKLASAS